MGYEYPGVTGGDDTHDGFRVELKGVNKLLLFVGVKRDFPDSHCPVSVPYDGVAVQDVVGYPTDRDLLFGYGLDVGEGLQGFESVEIDVLQRPDKQQVLRGEDLVPLVPFQLGALLN